MVRMRRGIRYVIEINRADKIILVRGFKAGDLLRRHGMKPLWSTVSRGWVLDLRRLPDVRAVCDASAVTVREVEADAA